VAWVSAIGIIGVTLTSAFAPGPELEEAVTFKTNPYALGPDAFWEVFSFVWILGFGGLIGSVAALVVRLRRSSGPTRQQLKWLAYAGAVAVAAFTIAGVLWGVFPANATAQIIGQVLIILALLLIPLAAGIAILRYRLYDIDVVIRKTVVFGVLAAFITLIYVAVVLLVPVVIFGAGEPFSLLPALAAVVVALAFQPLRRRAKRLANRVVYGKRATPYELLSAFSERVGGEYAIEDVLPRMARVLGEGTGARRADVWLRVGASLRRAASWPTEDHADVTLSLEGDGLPALPEADLVEPVRHRAELLGALSLAKLRGETVRPAEENLLRDLASQAGLVLRNVRLTAELEARLIDLQESRQRLVTAQDEERRRLERNLHDGAQQQLVALAVKLRLLKSMASKDAAKAEELADQLQRETQEALENLRDLARGIYPPLLADQGLPAALEAQARKSPVPVTVDRDGVGRYPADVEATVYFCVLEALQNVAKYADAGRVEVRLAEDDGTLVFEVEDDGRGFDPATTGRGSGLQNMADRLEALGGTVEVRSSLGHGTAIIGRLPSGVGA
jgi:signal transduction histidine kinase